MSDNMKLSKDKRHRSSSSITGAGIDATRSERKLDLRGSIPEVTDYFAVAESRCDDLQEKIELLKAIKRKKKMSKRSMTRVDGSAPENPLPLISVRTQPKKKVSGQAARLRRVDGSTIAGSVRGYVDPAYVEQHRMLGQVWAADKITPQNEHQAGPKQSQNPRTRRNRADGDGMCGQKIQAAVGGGLDDANYQDHQALSDLFHQDGRKLSKKNEASGTLDRAKAVSPDKQSGKSITTANRRLPKQPSPPPQQNQQHQQMYQHPYQQQLPLPKINESPVVELFNKHRSSVSPPLLASPRSRPDTRMDERDKPRKTHEEGVRSDLLVGQSATSADSYKKVRRKPWSRNYELPTVASQLKQVEARQSRSGAITNSSYIPFVISKNSGPSYNIGLNLQQVLNGLKIQQPLKDIPLTIAHHMGLGHIPTYKTKKLNILEKPSLSRSAINTITMGARTVTLPSRRCISYNRLLSMYSSGDGMVSRFLRANARVSDYLYTSLYETREAAEGSEQSEPSEQAEMEKAEQDEKAERDERAERDEQAENERRNVSKSARRHRRYQQLTQLYGELKRLERVHKDGAGNEETSRRYNEIIRILRANKDYMAQQEQAEQNKSSIPRKTSTNTTLVSSGVDRMERDSDPAAQVSAHDVRLHYAHGENRSGDPRKTPIISFH